MAKILIVESDPSARTAMASLVEGEGHEVLTASTPAEARAALAAHSVELVLADLGPPEGDGAELLVEEDYDFELAVIANEASLEHAVEALRLGALDYLTKPVDRNRLESLLRSFERTHELKNEVTSLRRELRDVGRFGPIIGASEPMREVYDLIEKVARTDTTVFITGDSGTGKELVANAVHRMSSRKNGPFLPLNCGAVSPTLIESELFGHEKGSFTGATRRHQGHFERAAGGTLFLDEITEMPIELQVKLLRLLETGTSLRVGGTQPLEVDVRVLAASNSDPRRAVEEGKLREDLYYRLRVFPIHLPPLRDRGPEDIELLTRHFLARLNRRHDTARRITDAALDHLVEYPWPGNVRELKNAVERAFILAEDRIGPNCLPREIRLRREVPMTGPYVDVRVGTPLKAVEKRMILATLDEFDGERKATAEALGISPKTLYNRLKDYESEDEAE